MRQHVRYGFSIILTAAEMVRLFGEKLKLSRIMADPQEPHRMHLKLNLLAQPDEGKTSVNDTMDREVIPESMQFGISFPHILQEIW